MERPRLFLRNSTGLVREIGPWTALLMNTAFIAFQTGFLLLLSSTFNFPRGNPIMAIAISAVLFLPLTILLNRIGVTYYRTASDYIFVTRNLNPSIGFATMLMFIIDQMFFNAILISLGLATGLAPAIIAIGLSSNNAALINMGNELMNNPTIIFIIGSIILAIFIAINIFSVRASKYVTSVISIFGIATFALMISLIPIYAPQIMAAINTASPNIVNKAIAASHQLPSYGTLMDTVYLIPYLAYVFPFVNFVLSVGGEVKRGSAMPIAIFGTYALSAILLLIGIWVTITSLRLDVINGLFAIYYGAINGVAYPSTLPPPYPQALLIMAVRDPVLQWLIAIGSFAWYVNIVMVLIMQIARYFLALSFDRLLPSIFAYVSPKTHTPIIAHITDLAITLVIMYLYNFSIVPTLSATMDLSTLITLLMYFAVITITATIVGLRTRSLITAMLGAYTTSLFLWIAYEEITNPLAYLFIPEINTYIIGFFVSIFIAGIAIYHITRLYRLRKENIDISIVFKEIPPE